MNTRQIGKAFEKEAYEILKGKFDEVEWLSENNIFALDFKCKKDGKIYYGDAKLINNLSGKVGLKYSQRDVDFIILKQDGKVKIIWKDQFVDKVCIQRNKIKTISIKPETWVRLKNIKSYPSQTFDTIINNLMDRSEIQNEPK